MYVVIPSPVTAAAIYLPDPLKVLKSLAKLCSKSSFVLGFLEDDLNFNMIVSHASFLSPDVFSLWKHSCRWLLITDNNRDRCKDDDNNKNNIYKAFRTMLGSHTIN